MPGSFPLKLHQLLNTVHEEGLDWIVSWSPQGNGFKVHNVKEFVSEILPRFFMRQTKYKSFQRQLNTWDFDRITKGPLVGAYVHSKFLRGNPSLCLDMVMRQRFVPEGHCDTMHDCQKKLLENWRGGGARLNRPRTADVGSEHGHQKNQQIHHARPMTLNECIAFFCEKDMVHSECEMVSTNPVNYSTLPPILSFDNLFEALYYTTVEDALEPIPSRATSTENPPLEDDPHFFDVGLPFNPTSLIEPVLYDMEMIFS